MLTMETTMKRMMGRGCGGREKQSEIEREREKIDREKGIVEVVNLVVSACK